MNGSISHKVHEGHNGLGARSDLRASSPAVALIDMDVPQLLEAARGLDRLETEYENMSGICAVLKGGILRELKRKARHGNYEKHLKEAFPNSSRTAQRYGRLWDAFSKNDSTVAFDALASDLASSVDRLKQFQLDLSHPIVARVAAWVNGRGAYQLMLDFPGQKGGDTTRAHKKKQLNKSPEEMAREEAQILYLPLQQKLFELLHNKKSKDRLLWLPLNAPAREASLKILLDEADALMDLLKAAIEKKKNR